MDYHQGLMIIIRRRKKVKERGLNIRSLKEFDKKVHEESVVFALIAKDIVENSLEERPEELREVLEEFLDIFPFELPDALPPVHDIQHAIVFVPSATLPNLPLYRMNPSEHAELQMQVCELLQKGFIREILSPCSICPINT